MRVVLTGATGFIGAQVLGELLHSGSSVTVLVVPNTLKDLQHRSEVKVVLGSLNDPASLALAVKGCDTVVHLAGKIPLSPIGDVFEVNVRGTGNLLEACARSGVHRFVFVSSAAVYRPAFTRAKLPIREESLLDLRGGTLLRNYGRSKVEAERLVLESHKNRGLEYVILRPTVAYGTSSGAGQRETEEILRKVLTSASRIVAGGPRRASMQWVHIQDLTDGILRSTNMTSARNQMFTIAGAEAFNFQIMASMMLEILNLATRFQLPRPWLTPRHEPNLVYAINKAQTLLGFTPKQDLRTGLSEMLDHMRRAGRLPAQFLRPARAGYRA